MYSPPLYYDAHCHWQDERLTALGFAPGTAVPGCAKAVVNGTRPEDWGRVLAWAQADQRVIPALGCHPWYAAEWSDASATQLAEAVKAHGCLIGEIGLDRWRSPRDENAQEAAFRAQWQLAVDCRRPPSVHCLQASGWLLGVLKESPPQPSGFLMHAFGGSWETVKTLLDQGAYFSFSGYFMHERKAAQRTVFQRLPADRLLVETDAPHMAPPADPALQLPTLPDGTVMNHPANLGWIYQQLADIRRMPLKTLANQVESNFIRLFIANHDFTDC